MPERTAAAPVGTAVGALMVVGSCTSLQLGAALAVGLFPAFGTWGTTLLRLAVAAAVLLAVVRPDVRSWDRARWGAVLTLGAAFAGMNGFYYAAIARIPLGVAVTLEFLGPLAVAAVLGRGLRGALWAALALVGVALFLVQDLVVRPAEGAEPLDPVGVGLVLVAAASWAVYILAGQRVGRLVPGSGGLAVAMAVAVVLLVPAGVPQLAGAAASPALAGAAIAMGVTASLLPALLEFHALRRLTGAAFGVLVSVEPAIAALIGLLLLGQGLGVWAVVAMVLVTAASVGSTLGGR